MVESLFNKVGSTQACKFIKETPIQVLSCAFLQTTASISNSFMLFLSWKRLSFIKVYRTIVLLENCPPVKVRVWVKVKFRILKMWIWCRFKLWNINGLSPWWRARITFYFKKAHIKTYRLSERKKFSLFIWQKPYSRSKLQLF